MKLQIFTIEGYNEKMIIYHLVMLDEAKLIRGRHAPVKDELNYCPKSLTWEGHAFWANVKKNPSYLERYFDRILAIKNVEKKF